MIRVFVPAFAATAALVLQGCCCCSLPSNLIPDDVADRAVEMAVEEGFEAATGSEIDAEQGRFRIETEEGSFTIGEGHVGIDPRIPVVPHPDCGVAGGAAIETKEQFGTGFAQEECAVPVADLEAHYTRQLEAQGAEIKRSKMSSNQGRSIILAAKGDGTRFDEVTVMLGEDEKGRTSAAVTAVLPGKDRK